MLREAQHENDARWEAHAKNLKAVYRRVYIFLPLIFIGAIAGAATEPVWSGALHTPAPHLIAALLATISAVSVAGIIWVLLRNRLSSEVLLLRPPKANSRGAFAMREAMSAPHEMVIVVNSVLAIMQGVLFASSSRSLLALVILLSATFILSAVALIATFIVNPRFAEHDELFRAMRGRAMQIGFWIGLAVLAGMMAGAFVGADLFRFLPLAFALTAATPCLAFVVLTRDGRDD